MSVLELFRYQARVCGELGSPMYADLIGAFAEDLRSGEVLAEVMRPWRSAGGPDAIALRLAAALHRLVLNGRAPQLAPYYPSVGGNWSLVGAWPVVADIVRQHAEDIQRTMSSPPQTNEVGRSAALMGGLLAVQPAGGLPVRLFEMGASAGLNLLFDRYRYVDRAGTSFGDSSVVIENAWDTRVFPRSTVVVADRAGCDISPIPIDSDESRTRLLSYVWPDMSVRLARLRGALDIASEHPPAVTRSHALDFVRDIAVQPGTLTVIWHSVMWQYVEAAEQAQIREAIAALSASATAQAPFVHLRLEPQRRRGATEHEFLLTADTAGLPSPSGILARCAPHGPPLEWEQSVGHLA